MKQKYNIGRYKDLYYNVLMLKIYQIKKGQICPHGRTKVKISLKFLLNKVKTQIL